MQRPFSTVRQGLLAAFALGMATLARGGTFDTNWAHAMKITFFGYDKPETLTNFPILVIFSNGWNGFQYAQCQAATNGGDLRFAGPDGVAGLPYEIETWDTAGCSYVWVKADAITGPADFLYAYWGSTSQAPPVYTTNGSTWNANYLGVWHMATNSSSLRDSTVSRLAMTANGTLALVPGKVGTADDFTPNAYFQQTSGNFTTLANEYTVSAWVHVDASASNYMAVVGSYNGNGFILALTNAAPDRRILFFSAAWKTNTSTLPTNAWVHVAYTRNSTNGFFYQDGTVVGRVTNAQAATAGGPLRIGNGGSTWAYPLDGRIDEVRVSSVDRSSNWVWACWRNQESNSFFQSGALVPTNPLARALPCSGTGVTTAVLGGQVVRNGNAEAPRVFVCLAYTNAGTGSTSAWDRVIDMGTNAGEWQSFSTNVTGLLSGSNYTYTCYATNSAGDGWSDATQGFQTVYLPAVTNDGAVAGYGAALLRGTVTDTGLNTPSVWFYYWASGGGPTSTVAMGLQTGAFSNSIYGLAPFTEYAFVILASNLAGSTWSMTQTVQSLSTIRYVATNATPAGGTNWQTAYTNIQAALDASSNGDVIRLAGHTFSQTTLVWSARRDVTLQGGYEATNVTDLPGSNNPTLWPTIVRPAASGYRVVTVSGITNSTLRGVTIRDGSFNAASALNGVGMSVAGCPGFTIDQCVFTNNVGYGTTLNGGGLYVDTSSILLTNCLFVKNIASANGNSRGSGGGAYINSGLATAVLCRFVQNSASYANNPGPPYPCGGGLYLGTATTSLVLRTVFARNTLTAYNSSSHGGGIANFGAMRLVNCLLDHNDNTGDYSDGLYAGGTSVLVNCTVADNGGVGILYGGGVAALTNTIVRGHSDDLKSFSAAMLSNVSWSCIQDGDNNGVQGCVSIDPLFVDTNTYHLQSKEGNYTNGYFSGGGWGTSVSNSSLIDAGDPAGGAGIEPAPNGGRINLGTYGNTEVASLTDTTTVYAVPAITNRSATLVGHRTAQLNAQVTDTGGKTPLCGFAYWIVGVGPTSTVSAGLQVGGFTVSVGGLTPGTGYQAVAFASNSVGMVWTVTNSFTTHPGGDVFYAATNADNTAGTNWSTAYTNLQAALDILEGGDVLCLAGHTFAAVPAFQQSSLWTLSARTNVTVVGGYAATNDAPLPGTNNPTQWPTILRRTSGTTRILYLSGITNGLLRGLTIQDGYLNAAQAMDGMGIYVGQCAGLALDTCVVSNNIAYGSTIRGGGLFVDSSILLLTNCLVRKNIAGANGNSRGQGGGLFISSGVVTADVCRVEANQALYANSPGTTVPHGGGLYLGTTSTNVIRRSVISRNYSTHASGQGAGIANYGRLRLENCLVDHNDQAANTSDGIYLGGTSVVLNCTVADNGSGVGLLYGAGIVALTNCIVWGHSDDLSGFSASQLSNVSFCCIQGGDNNGVQGCMSLDPLFVDTNTYHLQSVGGNYSNGYFSGGVWTNSLSNSPCIDAGDGSDYSQEPAPNGGCVNLGAYGNTEVASLTDTSLVVALPAVTNHGATVIGHRTVTLNGEVTDTGGQNPDCAWLYWIAGDSVTSTVSIGPQAALFSLAVSGLTPGTSYQFRACASNAAGPVFSGVKSFSTHPPADAFYVATNGNHTAGTNWSTAYTNLQAAFDVVETGDTVYLAGHTFTSTPAFQQTELWRLTTNRDIAVIGGYAATNDAPLPGSNDPLQWPTRLRLPGGTGRILYLAALTNCLFRNLTIADGYVNDTGSRYSMGVYINSSPGVTFSSCIITNIRVYGYDTYGGGLFVTASSVTLTNCVVDSCISSAQSNGGPGYGAGVFLNSGSLTILDSLFRNCSVGAVNGGTTRGGAVYAGAGTRLNVRRTVIRLCKVDGTTGPGYGGGVCNDGGTAVVQNCLIVTNGGTGKYGDGLYSTGVMAVVNCTIAHNRGEGVRAGPGSLALTNSILWENGDDLTGTLAVAFCDIQTPDDFWTNGVNGCLTNNPLFVDVAHYHESSRQGCYTNGYFSGGEWVYGVTNSPAVDAGDPNSDFLLEPMPSGRRVNLGAYGNTEVASKSTTVLPGTVLRLY